MTDKQRLEWGIYLLKEALLLCNHIPRQKFCSTHCADSYTLAYAISQFLNHDKTSTDDKEKEET